MCSELSVNLLWNQSPITDSKAFTKNTLTLHKILTEKVEGKKSSIYRKLQHCSKIITEIEQV